MKYEMVGKAGTLLLCAVLLAGCGNSVTNIGTEKIVPSAATQTISRTSQKFESAESYQKNREYYKAYILYKKVEPSDDDYAEAQERATQALDLYWKQQDELIVKQDYQTALNQALQSMNFANMTTFSVTSENGVESTILRVAESIAENCGFDNPEASWNKIYTISKFTINITCNGIDGKDMESLSNDELLRKYNELVNEYKLTYTGIFTMTLDEIHSGGKWYSVKDGNISMRNDREKMKDEQEKISKPQNDGNNYSGEITQEHKNALTRAESYYYKLSLSEAQVREQLRYEGFTADEINYAIMNLD